jgi:SAM-dependent methyltransferase
MDLETEFGAIDIYVFDQLLRGRIARGDRVLDAGCGFGRNLTYLLRSGFEVYGADADPDAIREVRALAGRLAPRLPPDNFRAEPIERMSFPDGFAQVVIASAVLHFARNDEQFDAMLAGCWRPLAPGGMLFCRLASTIGFETRVQPLNAAPGHGRRYRLPDGTDRYLVDEALLLECTRRLGGRLLDPIKTTVVQDQRAMTTWVVRKD